jgi:hypothetical protein
MIDGYTVDKFLGDREKNGQGLVYLVHNDDKKHFALKEFKRDDDGSFVTETVNQSGLDHVNIIKMISFNAAGVKIKGATTSHC